MMDKPTLYIVSTPIGNLEDITLRALKVLKEVDLILAEDTRVTKKLLQRYEIITPTMSYHAHSKIQKADEIMDLLEKGKNIALVSDAGTPTVSDPGVLLVSQVKERFGDRADVVPIPGASAVLAAVSASGLPASEFLFLGFLPHKKGRETLFGEIAESKRTVIFYESPHRILKALASLESVLGNARRVVVARELTKLYEEVASGNAREMLEHFSSHPDHVRGEFVVVVEGK